MGKTILNATQKSIAERFEKTGKIYTDESQDEVDLDISNYDAEREPVKLGDYFEGF